MDHQGKAAETSAETEMSAAESRELTKADDGSLAVDATSKTKKRSSKTSEETTETQVPNHLRSFREELCLSQAELARRANLSALTIARIEKGFGCRMSTKRRILEALGLSLAERKKVFGEEE